MDNGHWVGCFGAVGSEEVVRWFELVMATSFQEFFEANTGRPMTRLEELYFLGEYEKAVIYKDKFRKGACEEPVTENLPGTKRSRMVLTRE